LAKSGRFLASDKKISELPCPDFLLLSKYKMRSTFVFPKNLLLQRVNQLSRSSVSLRRPYTANKNLQTGLNNSYHLANRWRELGELVFVEYSGCKSEATGKPERASKSLVGTQ